MSPRTRKEKVYQATQAAIKDSAWRHIAAEGAAALSLRAIARELEVTAPALYRYFADRDTLVTALIIDAYLSFGDSQFQALEALPANDLEGRLLAAGQAYRAWAVAHPERFQLIFGTPIPGYHAPLEQVMPAAARSLSALVSVVEALRLGGRLRLSEALPVAAEKQAAFETWKLYGGQVDIRSFSIAIRIWIRVHGVVSLEISGNLPPYGPSAEDIYRSELETIVRQFVQ